MQSEIESFGVTDEIYIPMKDEISEKIEPDYLKSIQLKIKNNSEDYKAKLWEYKLEDVNFYIYYFLYLINLIQNSHQEDFYKETSDYLIDLIKKVTDTE